MSVLTLIAMHGVSVDVLRPTTVARDNGAMQRTYEALVRPDAAATRAFVQPASASDSPFSGRANMRVSTRFLIGGVVEDIQTDDVLRLTGTSETYWVRGVRVPILRPGGAANCHTIIDADLVPGETIEVSAPV